MWWKRILRAAGILAFAVLGFASVAILLSWLLSRREQQRAAVPAIEIDIDAGGPEQDNLHLEEEAVADEGEEAAPGRGAGPPEPGGQVDRTLGAPAEGDSQTEPAESDDLTRIRGIGPKIAAVLRDADITTFAALAGCDAGRLGQILRDADPRLLRLADPASWREQAELAAAGRS